MAVFISLHKGGSIRALRGIIRYNSKAKKGFHDDTNTRLIGVISNSGFCDDVSDEESYKRLTENFVLDIHANSLLSTNKRQKHIYEHSTISFDRDDDEKYGMKKLTELALKIADEANPNGAPQMLWPQIDSNKLHFHMVRGLHDENGKYQLKSNDYHRVNNFIQKLEKSENLTLTGKNDPNNWIWKTVDGKKKKTYFPGDKSSSNKITKNKIRDLKILINDDGDIKYINKINANIQTTEDLKNKNLSYRGKNKRLKINKIKPLQDENDQLEKPIKYGVLQSASNWIAKQLLEPETTKAYRDRQELDKKIKDNYKEMDKVNEKFISNNQVINAKLHKNNISLGKLKEDRKKYHCKKNKQNEKMNLKVDHADEKLNFKNTINNAYRKSTNSKEFLKLLNENNIEANITFHNNGKSGGITFNSTKNDDLAMAGGKVNSYLTFGKVKKNDPELFSLLTGETSLLTLISNNKNHVENNFKISNLNNNYKEKVNMDGSISIFYAKKNAEKYPHNHNIKINAEKNKISFGNNMNEFDVEMAYKLAKSNGWTNAESNNKQLILDSMTVAYASNKDDLLLFQTKEPTLKISELKDIIGNDLLSKDNLIKLVDGNYVADEDKKELIGFVKTQIYNSKFKDVNVIDIEKNLKSGMSLKESFEYKPNIDKSKEKTKQKLKESSNKKDDSFKKKSKYKLDRNGKVVKRDED
ncbi:hypothetical protein ACB087_26760 [Vibrio sp. VNB-15]